MVIVNIYKVKYLAISFTSFLILHPFSIFLPNTHNYCQKSGEVRTNPSHRCATLLCICLDANKQRTTWVAS